MDYTGAEKRTCSDSRRSGIDRRETALAGIDSERRVGAGDRRQKPGRRRTDPLPLDMLEQMR